MNDHEERLEDDRPDDTGRPATGTTDEGGASGDDRVGKLEDQLRRAMADLANFQRRRLKEVDEARHRALEGLTAELLPVLDNFHLAIGATESGEGQFDAGSIVEGMKMVRAMLEGVLERYGLTEIPSVDVPFDPMPHEAVGVDQDGDAAPGTITRVVQRGYRMNDKVLRASRVIVRGDADGDGASG